MNKEKLYLIIIIIFLIIFSAGIVFYAHIQNAGLTKTILSRVASFGPLWILDSNEGSSGINKFVKIFYIRFLYYIYANIFNIIDIMVGRLWICVRFAFVSSWVRIRVVSDFSQRN